MAIQFAPSDIARREKKPLPSLEDIQARRKIAEAMMQEGSSYAPVGHWTQAAARVAQALAGAYTSKKAKEDNERLQGDANDAFLGLMGGQTGGQQSVTGGMPPVPQQAVQAAAEAPMTPDQQGVGKFAQPNLMQGRVAAALDPSLVQAVKGFEGYTPKSQWDYKQHSVGYGTRGQPGETIDQPEAERRLAEELTKAQGSVNGFAPNAPEGVRKALTSLTFNAGDKWQRSGLGAAVQKGDLADAKNRFLQYNKAGGQTLPGLVNRRQQEAQWFDQPPQQAQAPQAAPQQLPQTADASQGQGLDRETLARLMANPLTREMAQKLVLEQAKVRMGGQTEYGLSTQYATDAQGNIVPWVPGKDGRPKMIQLPGGAKPMTPGQLSEEKASGRERGEVMGKTQGTLPAMEYNARRMIEAVDSLTNDPYLSSMLGPIDSRLPNVSADSGRVQAKIDQIQGKTFLQAFDSLRGAGQITEAEGNKATQSLNRLQATQVGTQDYYEAAEEFKKDVADLLEVARRKAGGPGGNAGWSIKRLD